ncbi:hypothetical protein DRQ33_01995, partial [bacterium]
FSGGNFLNLSRRIQGISASAQFGGFETEAFGSLMRGIFNSIEFTAEEGNQGPYPLWGTDGQRDIVVLAGSEKVWLNGELLKRGENNDYIIDYNLAQLTFTNYSPVGSSDRVLVDFQFVSQDYARNLFGAGVNFETTENNSRQVKLGVAAVVQNDDKNNPLVEISDSVRQVLNQAGDEVPDSLSAPQSRTVITTTADIKLERLTIGTEYAFSDFDKNAFSSIQDGDNFGDAYTVAGTLAVLEWLSLFSMGKYQSGKFEPLGRINPADFDRDWNMSTPDGENHTDKSAQGGLHIRHNNIEIFSWAGKRKWGDNISDRINLSAKYSTHKINSSLLSNYAGDRISSRLTDQFYITISGEKIKTIQTILKLDYYNNDTLTDTLYAKIGENITVDFGKLNVGASGNLFGYQIRDENNWGDYSRTIEFGGSISTQWGKLIYTRRLFFALSPDAGEDIGSDLISAWASRKIANINLAGNYQLSRSRSEILEKVYTYVGSGEGYYRWDSELEEYVYDSDGDYILEYNPTGEFQPVLRADGSFSASFPMDFIPLGASISADMSFHSENKRDEIKSYYLSPARMFLDDSLTSGTFSASTKIGLLRKSPIGILWSSSYRKTAYRIYSSGAELSMNNEHSINISGKVLWEITTSADGGIEMTQSYRPSLARWVDAQKYFAKFSLSRKIFKSLRLTLESELASIKDRGTTPETDAEQWSLCLNQIMVVDKFTLKSTGERVELNSDEAVLPYELSQGWYVGENYRWDATISYRAGAKTEFSIIYRGEKKADTDTKHTAELRVRLLFYIFSFRQNFSLFLWLYKFPHQHSKILIGIR